MAFARYTIMIRGQEMSQKSPVYKTEVLILHYILEKMPISIQFTNKPHLSTAVAWREKKYKHFVFNKYFSLVLGVLKSKISKKIN